MNEQTIEMQPEAYVAGQGGAVNSVNGQTGDVVLTTSDIENTSDYQTGDEVDATVAAAVAGKQDTLTAGNNIQINGDTISATDTTYTAGSGLDLTGTAFSVDTSTIATKQSVDDEITARQNADNNLQGQIDAISASSDVTDIVGTKAELNAYDTSKLKDNDIIKVLQDESQNDETTYYRWSTSTQTFTLIGEEGPYYTKSAVDTLLNAKQNTLTAGTNITIASDNTISATDTTYSNFTGTDGTSAGAAGLVPAPATTDAGKFLKADGTWDTAGSSVNVVQNTGTSTTDVMSQNATTGMVFGDPGSRTRVRIGYNASASSNYSITLGYNSTTQAEGGVAIGQNATAVNIYGVALGAHAFAYVQGQMDIGLNGRNVGYKGSAYRLLTGVYDGEHAHDAATYGQVISYSAINGTGAPTTATEGKYVGQLYYDTTNENMYFLKTIDTTTTPATYTWGALGGGGSSVNVVQTAGSSTTDVMSQNAVTGMIYANPGTNNKVRIYSTQAALGVNGIAIGNNAKGATSMSDTVAIGTGTQSTGNNSIAIGLTAIASGDTSIAMGSSAKAKNQDSIAFGGSSTASGNMTLALGYGSATNATGDIAIGGSATAGNSNFAYRATAIGQYSSATALGSTAIGAYSSASAVGQMDIGSTQTACGYNSSNYRLLTGLYDGQSAHDAANVGQLNSRVIGSLTAAPTTSTAGAVGALVATVESGTGHLYICTDDTGGTYTWQQLV